MKILIMGPSGSGKTYLSKEFKKMGLNTFDADDLDGLHGWYNWEKKRVSFPRDAGEEFMNNHEFLWDRTYLEDFLSKHRDVYLFGNSGNIAEMVDLFDKIYFLKVPEETIIARLDHESRENPMGKTDFQKKEVLKWAKENEEDAKRFGAKFIDGTLTAKEIKSLIED